MQQKEHNYVTPENIICCGENTTPHGIGIISDEHTVSGNAGELIGLLQSQISNHHICDRMGANYARNWL